MRFGVKSSLTASERVAATWPTAVGIIGRMSILGLSDPADYNAPTNAPVAGATAAGVTADGSTQAPVSSAAAEPAPAPADTTQDTYPPAPPTVAGVEVTESVYQQGA